MNFIPKYFIENPEDLKFLENAYKELIKVYSINMNCSGGKLIFEKNPTIEKSLHLTPQGTYKIEEITKIDVNINSALLKNLPEKFCIIKLSDLEYLINYKSR